MSCTSCKDSSGIEITSNERPSIFLRLFYFLVGVLVIIVLLPFLALIGMYMTFKSVVLNSSTDVMPSLSFISGLMQNIKSRNVESDDEEDYYDDENFDPEDYELVGVEEIKK